jgi:hypothetical protein
MEVDLSRFLVVDLLSLSSLLWKNLACLTDLSHVGSV